MTAKHEIQKVIDGLNALISSGVSISADAARSLVLSLEAAKIALR